MSRYRKSPERAWISKVLANRKRVDNSVSLREGQSPADYIKAELAELNAVPQAVDVANRQKLLES